MEYPASLFLIIGAIFASTAIDLFSKNEYVSTNLIMVSVGSGLLGAVLLITSIILYTLTALLKGRIKNIKVTNGLRRMFILIP